jgi:hypothetical protein
VSRRHGLYVALFLLAGLLYRLSFLRLSTLDLLQKFVVDDAFYYLNISRNIYMGLGASFDGFTPTNGFHPLYIFVVLPIFCFFSDPEKILSCSLALISIFSCLTAYPLFRITRLLTEDSRASFLVVFVYLFQPFNVFVPLSGVETALNGFLLSMTFWLYLKYSKWNRDDHNGLVRDSVLIGVFLGLSLNARTDNVLFALALLIHLLLGLRRQGRRCLMRGVWIFSTAFLLIFPWIVWNLVNFGTIVQVSGQAVIDLQREQFYLAEGVSVPTVAGKLAENVLYSARLLVSTFGFGSGLINIVICTAVLGLAFKAVTMQPLEPVIKKLRIISPVLFFAIFLFAYYAGYHWYLSRRYFYPLLIFVYPLWGICFSIVFKSPLAAGKQTLILAVAVLLFSVGFASIGQVWWQQGRNPQAREMYEAAQWIQKNLRSTRLGAFNAGIYGFFSGRTVVNLDGKVNRQAFLHRKEGRLLEYCEQTGIDYLVDHEIALEKISFPVIKRFKGSVPHIGDVVVKRCPWSGSPES